MSDFRGVLVRVHGGRASTIGGGMVDHEPGGSDGQRLGHPGWPQDFTCARTASTRDDGDCDTPARTMPGCSRFCPANPGSTSGCANCRARCRPLAHLASDTGLRSDRRLTLAVLARPNRTPPTQTRAGPPMPRPSPRVPDGIYISRTLLRCDAWDWSTYYLVWISVWEMVAGRHEAQPTVVGSSLSLPMPPVARATQHSR